MASCNASDAQQSWSVDASTGALTKVEPERRCLSTPSARESTGATIWGKRLSDGFAVVFLNQNSGVANITYMWIRLHEKLGRASSRAVEVL